MTHFPHMRPGNQFKADTVVSVVQGSDKEWSLGCVKRAPAARGDQGAGIMQPRDHSQPIPVRV